MSCIKAMYSVGMVGTVWYKAYVKVAKSCRIGLPQGYIILKVTSM